MSLTQVEIECVGDGDACVHVAVRNVFGRLLIVRECVCIDGLHMAGNWVCFVSYSCTIDRFNSIATFYST